MILLMGGCTVIAVVFSAPEVKKAIAEAEAEAQAQADADAEEQATTASKETAVPQASNPKPKKKTAPPTMNLALFGKVETGMSREEVESILKRKGALQSENEFGDIKTEMVSYKSGKRFDIANMTLTFQNGKLVSKAQFGLK